MEQAAEGTFDVEMKPGEPELGGSVSRYEFTKVFHGGLDATGQGVMLGCGDPAAGAAGYVAIETVEGVLGGRRGTFALQQLGLMQGGGQTLHYEIVPGSGGGGLDGITGSLQLTVEPDRTHRYVLAYEI